MKAIWIIVYVVVVTTLNIVLSVRMRNRKIAPAVIRLLWVAVIIGVAALFFFINRLILS